MTLPAGTRIGTYEVVAPLGAGGMGEVYRARDSKLHREVAIKVLREAVATDPDRLARFEREAQVLAALNHPHIAAIYGLEEAVPVVEAERQPHGVTALILELVEGPTLAERLKQGAIAEGEALPIARQIAEALEAAHEAGIVHRDLKPANIKLRPDGTVKVLDFGLAKFADSHGGRNVSSASSATETSGPPYGPARVTEAGIILGTVAYMAPEQARGRAVDKRVDIWAFGVVLWEMLAGKRLFEGETLSDTLAAVLTKDVDWTALPATTPASTAALLRRCLERDPRARLRDIGDARIELESPKGGDPRPAVPPRAATRARWWLVPAAVVGAFAVGAIAGRGTAKGGGPATSEVRFEIPVSGATAAALSPDASAVVVASKGPLRVRELSALSFRELGGTDGAVNPFWSPDGRTIAYGKGGKLWRVGVRGGAPAVICELPAAAWDHDSGGAWLPDDTIVFTTGASNLMRVAASGGDAVTELAVAGDDELHFHTVTALPGGRGLLYVVHRREGPDTIEVLAGGRRRVVVRSPNQVHHHPVFVPTGHILFGRTPENAGVWAMPFSLDSLEPTGQPYLVDAGGGSPSASATGAYLYMPGTGTRRARLRWHAPNGTPLETLDEYIELSPFPALSPDGTRVAYVERVGANWDVSVRDLVRGTRTRLTTGERAFVPAWLPGGASLVFDTTPGGFGTSTIKRVVADGRRVEELGTGNRPDSADGRHMFFDRQQGNDFDLMVRDLDSKEAPSTFVGGPQADVAPRPSPDGRLIAYMSMASVAVGEPEVMLRRFPATDERWQVSIRGGSWPRWNRAGTRVYYATYDGIYEVAVKASPEHVALSAPRRLFVYETPPSPLGPPGFDVARDGRFLLVEHEPQSEQRPAVVVLNWAPIRKESGTSVPPIPPSRRPD